MKVGLDVSPLHRPHPHGIVRVVAALAAHLERRGRVELVRLAPEPGAHLARWRQVELPRLERRGGLAGVHSCLSAFPLSGRGLRVQTVHELPWLHGVTENAGWRHRLWARYGPRRADLALTATDATARDLRAWSGAPEARVRVVPWGVDAVFDAAPQADDALVLARHGLARGRYVLCPGGGRHKKRAECALRGATELVARGGPPLAVAVSGPLVPGTALAGGLTLLGDVPDAELAALYRGAAAVAALARSEGFCLPVLEACASGVAALVPAGSAQAEVAGACGLVVDADDPQSVAGALERALASTDADRAARTARAAEFPWDRTAAAVEALWMELCA